MEEFSTNTYDIILRQVVRGCLSEEGLVKLSPKGSNVAAMKRADEEHFRERK